MHAIKMSLMLTLNLLTVPAFATIVPVSNEVVETHLTSEGGTNFHEGYVQLNKNARTISLVLQPRMPVCPMGDICAEVMPAPLEFFLENAKVMTDECGAVVYQAQQSQDHDIKVIVIDNTQYDYERCPTFLPVPATVVQVEQTFAGPESMDLKQEYLAGAGLSTIQY